MIRLTNLQRNFGKFTAVKDLNLHLPAGEVMGFLGPNGAGKTTTIKMITGLIKPTSGRILIAGIDMIKTPAKAKRRLGYIPDRPFLYGKLTPDEYLRFVGKLWDMPETVVETRIELYLKKFVLDDRRHELIEGLSHGMKQKVAITAAFIHQPGVIIVDEPMVGLDPLGARNVKTLFRHHADTGGAVFLSTHDLRVAEEVCDRVGIIHNGQLIALGTMQQLRQLAATGEKGLEDIFLILTHEQHDDGPLEPDHRRRGD